ncbi:MAG: exonuclease SbcCD subunit D [Gemmatimonadota bacterium]|nr:DNA repair exonuclease [Gemmatimonadota bacterium]
MRLVHLSDLHLGFRRYARLTPGGINQREADVAQAFKRAIDQVIALAPDLVLFGGDIFHVVRPSNPAIIHAYLQLSRLRQALPGAIVVMVAGNHDTPRAAETGCILRLFAPLGIHVADRVAERFVFPERDLAVLAVPDTGDRPALTPEPGVRRNVLLLHGEVEGVVPVHAAADDRAAATWTTESLVAGGWDYIALGHYHVYRQVAPNAWYSGALEYASANPWGELREERAARLPGKGFIEHDLDSRAHRFHAVPAPRALVDLPPIEARGLSAAELDAAIAAAVTACPGGIAGKVVRLVARDVPRHVLRELDHKAMRAWKAEALHFQLDARKPELVRPGAGEGAPGGRRRRALADLVADALLARPLEPGLERDRLVQLALGYLTAAADASGDAGMAAGTDEGAVR